MVVSVDVLDGGAISANRADTVDAGSPGVADTVCGVAASGVDDCLLDDGVPWLVTVAPDGSPLRPSPTGDAGPDTAGVDPVAEVDPVAGVAIPRVSPVAVLVGSGTDVGATLGLPVGAPCSPPVSPP